MTTAEATRTATNKVNALTTNQIIESFELLQGRRDADTAIVRGWLMDELEARNATAFDKWLDSTEESPRSFFI